MPTVIRLSYCLRALIDLDSDNEVSRSRACIVDAVQKDYIMWKKNRRSSAAAPQLTQMKMKAKPSLEKSTMLFNHLSLVLTSTTVIIRSSGTPPPRRAPAPAGLEAGGARSLVQSQVQSHLPFTHKPQHSVSVINSSP